MVICSVRVFQVMVGSPPESKRPPDDLDSWNDVLEKVGVSAALSKMFIQLV
jgi:hypothetical protein